MIDTSALKDKILELAMYGKLSERLIGDVTAEEIYTILISEKKEILKVRKGRDDKKIKALGSDVPYELPNNWKWVRFGEIGFFKKGPFGSALTKVMFVPKSKDTVKVYEQQHAIQKNSKLGTYYITREYFDEKMSGFEVLPGDILVSCAGTIGETYIVSDSAEHGIINQALMRVTLAPSINKKFFQYYFDSNLKKTAQETSNGSAIKNMPPFDVMKNWYFPLAPYNEQLEIVEKVDAIFRKIDVVDSLQKKYAKDVVVLRNILIDAGIQGKLTEHLSEDGTVEEIIGNDIISEKDKILTIPDSWKWVRLGWVMDIERGGSPRPIKEYLTEEDDGINWIKIGDVEKNGKYISQTREKIKPEGKKKSRKVYPGDFLLTNSMSFGRPYISQIEGCIHDGWLLLRNSKDIFDLDYLYWLLSSKYAYNQFAKKAAGATVDNLNKDKVASAIVPVPPLAEQKRIAKKIEELMQVI